MKFAKLSFPLIPLVISAALAAPQSAPAEGRDAILVLDASGSMWGEVSGRHKIEIAREVVADVIATLPENTRLGLMAYGHNRKGDCEDIELLIPVGPVDSKKFLSTVNGILPKGKTPLTTAIRMAALGLQIGEKAASVILITDGIETCGGDPCALAKELAAQGLDFTAHVIAFDVASNEAASIRCLADETGGLFLEAGDRKGLERALKSALETLAVQASGADFLARNSTTDDPLPGTTWIVKNAADEEIARLPSPVGSLKLEAGEYKASATWESQSRQIDFVVIKGRKTPVEIAFGPATLRLAAAETRDSTPITRAMRWKVFALNEKGEPATEPIISNFTAQPEFKLEPGSYRATVDYGESQGAVDVELEGGEIESQLVITGSGTVEIKTLRAGEPLKGARNYSLYSIGPDGEPEEKALLSNFTSTPTFVVPAGRYLVSAKDGTVGAKETVQVDASETVEVVLSFDTGTLKISSTRGGAPLKKARRYQVFRADDEDGKPVTGQFTSSPSFVLSPGDYIVSAKDGFVLVESAVTVQSGKDSIVTLEFDTGVVSAKAVHEGKPLGNGGRFTVNRSGEEEKVASQFTHEVSFSLPPGDYEMRFEGGSHIGKATFTVQTGKTTELEVPVTEK